MEYVTHEYASTASDVLARRTRLAFLDHEAAVKACPRIVEVRVHVCVCAHVCAGMLACARAFVHCSALKKRMEDGRLNPSSQCHPMTQRELDQKMFNGVAGYLLIFLYFLANQTSFFSSSL